MAADHHHHDIPAMDYAEHEKTFGLFAGLVKWGTVLSLAFVLVIGAVTATISWPFALIVIAAMTAITMKFF
jgi:hypothetical protein